MMSEKLSDFASHELGNIKEVPPWLEGRIVSGIVALEQQLAEAQQRLRNAYGYTWVCEGCQNEFAFEDAFFVFEEPLYPECNPHRTEDDVELCDACWAECVKAAEQESNDE